MGTDDFILGCIIGATIGIVIILIVVAASGLYVNDYGEGVCNAVGLEYSHTIDDQIVCDKPLETPLTNPSYNIITHEWNNSKEMVKA